ncbi:hypothetical protein CK227_10635 [Mesorhizobium sp. WSM4308]|nr:hypothetical protein CK232_01785 [Mesorhizobium sp. WSM4304]PBB75237.1 hypothetical protein CK227_10635 [Mesorhizobium sp. WSM4308]
MFFNSSRHHHSVTNWTGKRRVPVPWSKITVKGKFDPTVLAQTGEFVMKSRLPDIITLGHKGLM